MAKLIIDNRSDLNMETVLHLVSKVVSNGRLSNGGKEFCYLTSFLVDEKEEYHVVSGLNKSSDKFVVYKNSSNP